MYNAASYSTEKRINKYLVNEIRDAKPEQLIMKVYDFAITNCQKKNLFKTNDSLQVLINALNFQDEAAKDISIGLLRLYQFCQDQARKNNFDIVYKILTELRDTWNEALKNRK